MQRKLLVPAIFFALIAILMLAELFFSNLGSLMGNLEKTASSLGLSVGAEQARLWILILLDAVGGIGAALAVWAVFKPESRLGSIGVLLTTLGLLGYGLYQLYAALFQLAPNRKGPIMGVGITYAVLGVVAWYLGKPLREQSR